MKFWLDTEFIEDGKTIDLLSIGIVREDGQEYYAVSLDADWSKAGDWVKENVLPHLDRSIAKSRRRIRDEIHAFILVPGMDKPEIWAYYADYDWVAFCQLFGRMVDLPKGFPRFCRDVKQLSVDVGVPELPKQISTSHHALSDARWTREAYLVCMQRKVLREIARP